MYMNFMLHILNRFYSGNWKRDGFVCMSLDKNMWYMTKAKNQLNRGPHKDIIKRQGFVILNLLSANNECCLPTCYEV